MRPRPLLSHEFNALAVDGAGVRDGDIFGVKGLNQTAIPIVRLFGAPQEPAARLQVERDVRL